MEYVEGKTLDKHIAHHKLKLGEALRLAVQIAMPWLGRTRWGSFTGI
jgi:hypothetical protein